MNTEDLPYSDCTVTFPELSFLVPNGIKAIDLASSLKSVLFRRPGKPFDENPDEPLDEAVIRYTREQWHAIIDGILCIPNVLWINHPRVNDIMECKIVQLQRAVDMGFRIPQTCVTSSKERAEKFIQSCGGYAVAKSLYSSLIEYPDRDFFIFTTVVESIKDIPSSEIGIAPMIFQEYLEEKIDYRVTVVGEKVHTVRIESRLEDCHIIDWRAQKDGLKFNPSELPEDVQKRCIDYVKECGLVFGAIDMVLYRDDFYFLEINPNGEWGWLQTGARLPIAEALTDYLIKGCSQEFSGDEYGSHF